MKQKKRARIHQTFCEALDRHCKDPEELMKVLNIVYEILEFIDSQKNHSQDIILDLRKAKEIVAEYSDDRFVQAVQIASDELIAGIALSQTRDKEIGIFFDIYSDLNID